MAEQKCQWCGKELGGDAHAPGQYCPLVRSIEFYENGFIKRVEFERGQGIVDVDLPINLKASGDDIGRALTELARRISEGL